MLSCLVLVHFLSIEYVHVQTINVCETTSVVADLRICIFARKETTIEVYLLTKAWPPVTRRIYVASEVLGKYAKM